MYPHNYSSGYLPIAYNYSNDYFSTLDRSHNMLNMNTSQTHQIIPQPQIFYYYPQTVFPNTFNQTIHSQSVVLHNSNIAEMPSLFRNRRKNDPEKELESAKKNSQSNILNQLYSYFNCCEASQKIVLKAIRRLNLKKSNQQKVFRLIILKRGRKYINKDQLIQFYHPQNMLKEIPQINEKLLELNILTLEELCILFRLTTSYFIRQISINALLTSKRIKNVAKLHHLRRRRIVMDHILKESTKIK